METPKTVIPLAASMLRLMQFCFNTWMGICKQACSKGGSIAGVEPCSILNSTTGLTCKPASK